MVLAWKLGKNSTLAFLSPGAKLNFICKLTIAWSLTLHAITIHRSMTDKIFEITYASYPIHYSFNYPATRYQFRDYIRKSNALTYDIRADEDLLARARNFLPENSTDSYVEYRALIGLTGKELLKYDCCILHAVSFVYKGFVWLLSAPSGTGKTTQYRNWCRLFPEEIKMISGDMPVLENQDGKIYVYPTSWNGKENIGNKISGPLGGVVYLSQDDENIIKDLSVKEGVPLFMKQFMGLPDNEREIRSLFGILDGMFSNYPVWVYHNRGDDESTLRLRDKINEFLEGE